MCAQNRLKKREKKKNKRERGHVRSDWSNWFWRAADKGRAAPGKGATACNRPGERVNGLSTAGDERAARSLCRPGQPDGRTAVRCAPWERTGNTGSRTLFRRKGQRAHRPNVLLHSKDKTMVPPRTMRLSW